MLVRIVSLLIANALIVGCSFIPTQQAENAERASGTEISGRHNASKIGDNDADDANKNRHPIGQDSGNPDSDSGETIYSPFPAPTLYSLLVAEIAGQRQQYDVSLANYFSEAKKTHDPAIAERATRIAQYVGAHNYILESAKIWVASDPYSASAHQVLAQALMRAGDFSTALKHMEAVLELAGASQFDYLALSALQLNKADKLNLLSQFELLTQKHSDYAQLWMAQGSLLLQLADYEAAIVSLDKALDLRENYTAAALNKARALHKLNKAENALSLLDDLHASLPNHKGIGVLRARVLIDLKRYSEARAAFQYLALKFKDDHSIKLSLALLHMELEELDEAIAILSSLTLDNAMADEAYFYLARSAELQKDPLRAIRNYRQVQKGRQLLPSMIRVSALLFELEGINAARDYTMHRRGEFPDYNIELAQVEIDLLIKAKDIETAYKVADEALVENPDNTNLLYSRGLLAEKLNNLDQLEADLRHIISINPKDAEAINALGYTLANKTDRIDEAFELIEHALELSPGNPAIIDSLGWAHFRSGDLNSALPLLEQAFEKYPDHEVAAHLGEVLWKLDRPEEAKEIWQQGLEHKTDSPIILEVLERLKVDFQRQGDK
jgi:tetratricopeptide (TPR) repeat protein